MEQEIWLPVVDFEGFYEVSNLGRIKSIERTEWANSMQEYRRIRYQKFLSPRVDQDGYLQVTLHKDTKKKFLPVHRIVAMAFIPNPNNLPEVNHLKEPKTNNRVDNLEWADRFSQMKHASENGLLCVKDYTQMTEQQVLDIRKEYNEVKTGHRTLAKRYGVCKSTITNIVTYKSWKHI